MDRDPRDEAVYVISVAAELAGMHPQTLRTYERKGLLEPARTQGNTRRYSPRDIDRLRLIAHLTQDAGLNLSGVRMVLDLHEELERMRRRAAVLEEQMRTLLERTRTSAGPAAGRPTGSELVPRPAASLQPHPRYPQGLRHSAPRPIADDPHEDR